MLKSWNFEERLQEIIAEYPSFVAEAGNSTSLFLAGREIVFGQRLVDILLLDQDGAPTIVETKLLRNADYNTVVKQAVAYRTWLTDRPEDGANIIDLQFNRVANLRLGGTIRYLMCRLGSDVHDAGTLRLQLRGRILKALRERRIRVAVVADAITPELVERAEVARERDRTLTIDMIELLPDPNGGVVRRFIEPMADRSRRWHRPVFGTPDWEPVATEPLAAAQLRKKLPRDRFYEGHGPRVLRVSDGFPEAFACERSFGRVPGAGRPIHQVDPSRQESCAPLMPSHRLYVETGAPYPPEPPVGLITDEWYKPFVRISYATWRALAATGTMVVSGPNDPAVHAVVAAARVQPHQQHAEDALRCVTDTLRDLALWGFVGQARRGFFERRFQLELPNQAR